MRLLEFIFKDCWHFFGTLILLSVVAPKININKTTVKKPKGRS